MSKLNVLKGLFILFAFLLLFGCVQKAAVMPTSSAQQLDGSMYTSKVDNFLVIFDSSSSMYDLYNESTKFDIAKRVAMDMNITLPEMGQTAGLRPFGHAPYETNNSTELFYGMKTYSSAELDQSLNKIAKPGGTTPLSKAIEAASDDFQGLSGVHNALLIFSDGLENDGSAIEKTNMLKEKYGSSLCIYTILAGNDPKGAALMTEIASIGGCGFSMTSDQLRDPAAMKDFVEKVFLAEKPVEKAAAPAPAPAPEPEVTTARDSDNDGVIDNEDDCPGTPIGAHVNATGCWVLDQVLFDYDKAVIKPKAQPFLDNVADIMDRNPNLNVSLQGHTDNVGPAEYNMGLSERRANAVKEYLVSKGIPDSRMTTKGFGLTKPIALNGTKTGRALNRRVEIIPE